MKQKKFLRHHWFLVCVFAVILLLAVVAFILQRSTNLDVIAGEAIRQQIDETKQLTLSKEEIKIAVALKSGEKDVFQACSSSLYPAAEQHWKLDDGWKIQSLKSVDVQCTGNTISCYYADSGSEINRADQIVTYFVIPKVKNCKEGRLGESFGCDCEIDSSQ